MNYDEMEEREDLADLLTDITSILLGVGVALFTAKKLYKVLPRKAVRPISVAVSMATANLVGESITVGRHIVKTLRSRK